MKSSVERVVVVTVALRRPPPRIAVSPKKSPGPSVPSSTPSAVTRASPSTRTKNEYPLAPSLVRRTPSPAVRVSNQPAPLPGRVRPSRRRAGSRRVRQRRRSSAGTVTGPCRPWTLVHRIATSPSPNGGPAEGPRAFSPAVGRLLYDADLPSEALARGV